MIASMEKELSHGFDSVSDLADEAAGSIRVALSGGDWADCWLIRVRRGLCVTSMRTMVRTAGRRAWCEAMMQTEGAVVG